MKMKGPHCITDRMIFGKVLNNPCLSFLYASHRLLTPEKDVPSKLQYNIPLIVTKQPNFNYSVILAIPKVKQQATYSPTKAKCIGYKINNNMSYFGPDIMEVRIDLDKKYTMASQ